MPKTKTATLNLRIDPGIKEAIRMAAEKEHRSVANMVEVLIRRHSATAGIRIPEHTDLAAEKHESGHPHSQTNRSTPKKYEGRGVRTPEQTDLPSEKHDG